MDGWMKRDLRQREEGTKICKGHRTHRFTFTSNYSFLLFSENLLLNPKEAFLSSSLLQN